jgi:hypothetical protein
MKVLSIEKSKLLADQYGWSLAYAQGLVDGESSRRLGKAPTLYALVGIDEYSLGFRAGYFDRETFETPVARSEPGVRRSGQIRTG